MRFDFQGVNRKTADWLFVEEKGYGFVEKSWFYSVRQVSLEDLVGIKEGIYTTGEYFRSYYKNENEYNYGGMIFRYRVQAGAFHIKVKLTEDFAPVSIGITGMQGEKLEREFPWNPAGTVLQKCRAYWTNRTWEYDYVSGNGVIDVEIEPKSASATRTSCDMAAY